MDILRIENLYKRFGDNEVLRGLNLTVAEHSVYGFIGKNGAGKTTAMKAILGLLRVDSGEITVNGERVTYGQSAANRFIGYLPDVPEFYSFMTAREYLTLCGESLNMKKDDITARTEELLTLVGLSDEDHRIRGFSRGMKQRLGIAQALFARPKLLICDEPTSALDPIGRKEILDLLYSVREQTTVLFSTHILSDVERICTEVALINDGKIAMAGTVDELKRITSSEQFAIELMDNDHADAVLKQFDNVHKAENGTLMLKGGDEQLHLALDFMHQNGISLRKIERFGASLESVFEEVVKK